MDHFDQASVCFQNGQIKEALFHFQEFLNGENPPSEKVMLAYQQVLHIHLSNNETSSYIDSALRYSEYLINVGDFTKAYALLVDLGNLNHAKVDLNKGQILRKLILCTEKMGELELNQDFSIQCLEFYLYRKNIGQGLRLAIEMAEKYQRNLFFKFYQLKFYILQNNHLKVNELLIILFIEIDRNEKLYKKDLDSITNSQKEIKELFKYNYSDDQNSVVVREFLLRTFIEEGYQLKKEENYQDLENICERILNFILESILISPYYLPIYYLAAKYYMLLERFNLSEKLMIFIVEKKDNAKYLEKERTLERISELESEISRARESTPSKNIMDIFKRYNSSIRIDEENVEKGMLDLSNLKRDGSFYSEIERIEKKIRISFMYRKMEDLNSALKELEKMDPESFVLASYKEMISGEIEKTRNTDSMESDLISEIEKGGRIVNRIIIPENGETNRDNFEYLRRSLTKFFQTERLENLRENYSDIVVALHVLGLEDISIMILDRIEKDLISSNKLDFNDISNVKSDTVLLKKFLDINYLKITFLMQRGEMAEALSLAEYINTSIPLNKEEFQCFFYLEAEILRSMGKREKALRIYRKIRQVNPAFRLTVERITDLESN